MHRRQFLQTAAAFALPVSTAPAATAKNKLSLGFDNFSVRALGLKAGALIDYAAEQKVDCLLISDLDAFDSHDGNYLTDLRIKAANLGVALYAGTGGICPSAHRFSDKWGNAEDHLKLAIKVARMLGSPVVRVFQGYSEDRRSPGGIKARIQDTLAVLKSVRSYATDNGIKIAIENHAGDMQSRELRDLVLEAGPDWVGVNIDSGNAVWALEDPFEHLEILAPHVLCSSLRDSMIWEDENGATIQWTAMGDGIIDMKAYGEKFARLCTGVPFILETIGGFPKSLPFLKPEFWNGYENTSPASLAKFLALAKTGKAIPPFKPEGDKKQAEAAYQKEQLERSLAWCRENL